MYELLLTTYTTFAHILKQINTKVHTHIERDKIQVMK
jgi:hypothetical protein